MIQNFAKPRRAAVGVAVTAVAALGVVAGSTMSASAADPVATMSASPNPLTFDDVAVGASKDAVMTLRSSGTAPVVVSGVANVGRDASQYSLPADGCTGQTLAPGATCAVTVRFSPTNPRTLVTNIRFRSTNACTVFADVAGGGTTTVADAAAPRAASGCEVVTTPGPTTTTPAATVTTPGSTTSTTVTAPAVTSPAVTQTSAASSSAPSAAAPGTATSTGAVAGVTASSPKICKSRRTITFNVKPKKGTTLAKVSVRVNNKLVKVFKKPKSGKLKTQLKLTGQPRTRVKVVIRSTTTAGKASTRTQYFVTCVPKRASSN